jgi:hypothetical protein
LSSSASSSLRLERLLSSDSLLQWVKRRENEKSMSGRKAHQASETQHQNMTTTTKATNDASSEVPMRRVTETNRQQQQQVLSLKSWRKRAEMGATAQVGSGSVSVGLNHLGAHAKSSVGFWLTSSLSAFTSAAAEEQHERTSRRQEQRRNPHNRSTAERRHTAVKRRIQHRRGNGKQGRTHRTPRWPS